MTEPPLPVRGPSGSAGDTEIKPGFVHSLFFERETLNFFMLSCDQAVFFLEERGKERELIKRGWS